MKFGESNSISRLDKTYNKIRRNITSRFPTKGRQVVDGVKHWRFVRHLGDTGSNKRMKRPSRSLASLMTLAQVTSHPFLFTTDIPDGSRLLTTFQRQVPGPSSH